MTGLIIGEGISFVNSIIFLLIIIFIQMTPTTDCRPPKRQLVTCGGQRSAVGGRISPRPANSFFSPAPAGVGIRTHLSIRRAFHRKELALTAAIWGHSPHSPGTTAIANKGNGVAIRRPGWQAIISRVIG
jgi:hypothetical protein